MLKRLNEILPEINGIPRELFIHGIKDDSRQIKKDELFLAYQGEKIDRKQFAREVHARGGWVLSDTPTEQSDWFLPNLRAKIGIIAERFWDFPSQKLDIIGITGTNGKTTVAYLLYQALNKLGISSAFIGTLGILYGDKRYPTNNTTLGALALTEWLAKMVKEGLKSIVMEVSAHALSQYRVDHLIFKQVLFTNLSRDHLDYYRDISAYQAAKAKLFYLLPSKQKIINLDDPWGKKLTKDLSNVVSYSLESREANISAIYQEGNLLKGTTFRLISSCGEENICTSLIGKYNISNLLAVISVLKEIINIKEMVKLIPNLSAPPGRLEIFQKIDSPWVVVDYAHTPDALRQLLMTLRPLTASHLGIVFGCGGNRDRGKRAIMGEIVNQLADWSIITNDNARNEDPERIAQDIIGGMPKGLVGEKILNRHQAIGKAIKKAHKGDIVIIAGRGHEEYLESSQGKIYCSDREIVREELNVS